MSARLAIGLMIHHLDNDYSKAVLSGAAQAARELDADLAVFPGRSLNSQLSDAKFAAYEYQNNVIYSYVSKKMLNAVIVSAGTVGSFVSAREFKAFLDGYEGLPVITMENKIEGFPCIRLSGSGIKDIVSHLIKVHGRKNIAFVSGPKGNSDAEERLSFYREALIENGLEYDPDMVVYGKFSEYCSELVGELIDRHKGKIDAVCFANDMMCKGGCRAIEERGLRIGKDISVTGYDDSEAAASFKPPLTTVRANACKLGARAVEEAVRMARGGTVCDVSLGSKPVYRLSCGCMGHTENAADRIAAGGFSSREEAERILADNTGERGDRGCLKEMRDFIVRVLDFAGDKTCDGDILSKPFFGQILSAVDPAEVSPEDIVHIVTDMRAEASALSAANAPERMGQVQLIAANCAESVSERILALHYEKTDDIKFTNFLIGNITKNMISCGSDKKKTFLSIVNNLYRANIKSCCIYTYDSPVIHKKEDKWHLPETVTLCAQSDGSRTYEEEIKLPSFDVFRRLTSFSDRQHTAVVFPLYLNEEQYGVIVIETDNEYFPYVYSIASQICTAIKLIELVARLECSINDIRVTNDKLSRMSMCDELTGIYNRRGFYFGANKLLRAPENKGRKAFIIFGDLDNLKKINDTFGHEEGDRSIVTAADFLKSSLRSSDVVARIGGDEFAAFALFGSVENITAVPERIKFVAGEYNKTSPLPYNITVSVGCYELVCGEEEDIRNYMDFADSALYEDKKRKNPDIIKRRENGPSDPKLKSD